MASASAEPVAPGTATADIEMGDVGVVGTSDTSNLLPEPKVGKGFLKPVPERAAFERLALCRAIAAVFAAIIVTITEPSVVVIIAGLLSVILAPYAYHQQVQFMDILTLQETEEKMKMEVDRLTSENKRLAYNIDEMTDSVQRLKDIGDALDVITQQQGQSVEAFRAQVEEQRNLLGGMQDNLSAKIIDNLLSLAFGADQNDDNIIDPEEANGLIQRIQHMSGVSVKEDKFLAAISGQSADRVIDIIDNLIREDLPEEQRLFTFTEAVQ